MWGCYMFLINILFIYAIYPLFSFCFATEEINASIKPSSSWVDVGDELREEIVKKRFTRVTVWFWIVMVLRISYILE
jgi:hypothetical protein